MRHHTVFMVSGSTLCPTLETQIIFENFHQKSSFSNYPSPPYQARFSITVSNVIIIFSFFQRIDDTFVRMSGKLISSSSYFAFSSANKTGLNDNHEKLCHAAVYKL